MKINKIFFLIGLVTMFSSCQIQQATEITAATDLIVSESPAATQIRTLESVITFTTEPSKTRTPRITNTPFPSKTPSQTPTQGPSATPRSEITYSVIRPTEAGQVDIQATYTAIAADYDNRIATMLPPVAACELAPRELGWHEYRIDEIGLTMQLPQDWSDMDYRTYKPNQSNMFKVKNYGIMTSSAMVAHEGIIMHIWHETELDLIPFIKELRDWAATKDGMYAATFSPLPHENSLVNGHPASIAYIPAYDFGEPPGDSSWARFVTVTKIGEYVIMIEYEPRRGYDPTETMTSILSSLSIDGVAGGETKISKVVLCQMITYSCLDICHFTPDEMMDDNIFRP